MGPDAGAGEVPRRTAGSGSSGRTSGHRAHQARPSSANSQNTDGQPNALISGPQISRPIAEPRSSEPNTVVTARARSPLDAYRKGLSTEHRRPTKTSRKQGAP